MYVDLAHEFPAEEACGVLSPSPRLVIPGQMFLKFLSAAIVDIVCTLMSMSETHGHLESQASFLGPEQRPWWSLVGQCGEGGSLLGSRNWTLQKLCDCACHPLPSASYSWFVLVSVVQGKMPC